MSICFLQTFCSHLVGLLLVWVLAGGGSLSLTVLSRLDAGHLGSFVIIGVHVHKKSLYGLSCSWEFVISLFRADISSF
jgi:hypothetical protein